MKKIFFSFLLSFMLYCGATAQINENFSDGDFTANPSWVGSSTLFQVNAAFELQSNGNPLTDTLYLSTPNTLINMNEWRIKVQMTFAPSDNNLSRIYLVSDQADLTSSLNGYYLRLGENGANDAIKLYRQDGATHTLLATGTLATLATNPLVNLKVTRDNLGLWSVSADFTGGIAFAPEFTFTDNTYTSTAHFGVWCKHTSTNNTKFYFDDIYVGAPIIDITPPTVLSATPIANNQLDVLFDESVSLISGQLAANYSVNNGIGVPSSAIRDNLNNALVHLTFANTFNSGNYQLTVTNVEDLSANAIVTPQTANFSYTLIGTAAFKDVILNEILADPSPQVGLPNVEFVEIYNNSTQNFNLNGWNFTDGTTNGILGNYILAPNSYLTLTATANVGLFSGNVLGLSAFPSLNNSGDNLKLLSDAGVAIDSVNYLLAWYATPSKALGGWSLELINPNPTCLSALNWAESIDPIGGTPSLQNSVFSTLADITPPLLLSTDVTSNNTVDVCFNEVMDIPSISLATHYNINNGIGTPTAVSILSPQCVQLTFAASFNTGTNYILTINNVQDCSGNLATPPLTTTIFLSPTAAYRDIIMNELLADPSPQVGLPDAEFVELYNRSATTYNLNGWILTDGTSNGTIGNVSIPPNGYVILTATANVGLFTGNVIGVPSFPSLNNSGDQLKLLSDAGTVIDSVNYLLSWYATATKALGGWSLELINPNPACLSALNWAESIDPLGGTPDAQNSVYSTAADITPPALASVDLTSTNTLDVCFNEAMDIPSISLLSNYTVGGGIGNPISIVLLSPQCVKLTFAASFSTGVNYTLVITNVTDCSGNAPTAALTDNFFISPAATYHDIIINEIFADPSPQIGLPNAEYVELYNRSAIDFNLSGWSLSDGTSNGTIGSISIPANGYVILTSTANVGLFTGNVVGVVSFPSLNNTDDSLWLRDNQNLVIDSLAYTLAWYNDPIKDDGGWSLELINPNPVCASATNWTSSIDTTGGTPGAQNSVYNTTPDTTPPTISESEIISPDTLAVCFNETMSLATLTNAVNYSVNNGIGQPLSVIVLPDNQCVWLVLPSQLVAGTVYTLTVSNIQDCSGNTPALPLTAQFSIGLEAVYKDVIINELIADPTPEVGLPNAEFVELYNRSTKPLDISGWQISDGSSSGTIGNYLLLPNEYVILTPTASVSLFTATNVVGVTSFPSLNNSGDNLGLRSYEGILIDSLNYSIGWYNDAIKDDGGWTLELINPNSPCSSASNWAAATDPSGGTPGLQNSIYSTAPDITPPTILSATLSTLDTLLLCFNESIDPAIGNDKTHYSIDNGIGQPQSVAVISPDNQCVSLILANPLSAGVVYTLTVTGMEDCSGNPTTAPLTVAVVKGIEPLPFDVIITEIFADYAPSVGLPEAEFVEIYNRTNKVLDISNWKLRDIGTAAEWGQESLLPYQYAVICASANAALFSGFGKVIATPAFPSLNNDKDSLYLEDSFGFNSDLVFYSDSWYQDDAKKQGGWSLERLDVEFVNCNNAGNWSASNAAIGGTPATVNSISGTFSDTQAPTLKGISILNSSEIKVYFSEQMDAPSLQMVSSYSIDNGIGQPAVIAPEPVAYSAATLVLNNPIQPQILYRLILSGLKDCAGNAFADTAYFGIPDTVRKGDILLNEVLFNPYTNGSDYIEIINKSNKVLDLSQLILAEIDGDSVFNVQLVSEQSRLLLPQSIVCLTTDVDFQKNTYNTPAHAEFYEVNSLPSYDDTKGGIILMSTTDTLDVLTYDKSNLTQPAFEDGVAWERNSSTAAGEVLWNTAASLVNYGTPGYANSHVGYLGKVSPQDLQINELLFNSATGGSDFVEIYNNSPEAINISNILVGKVAKGETEITALAHLLGDRDTLKSGELLAISGNILFNKQYYQTPPEAKLFNFPATPTFDDTEGEVVLMHRDGTVIERFHYYDDYHFVALSDKNGVSLERISRNVTVNQATNWHSAASTVNYATPGYENSMREELLGGDEEVSLEYTTFTPNNDGDKDVLAINYSLNVQGANVRADIFDATGLLVKNLELNQLVGAEKGTFFWDGTTNDNERALIGMYVVLIEVQVVETGKKQRYKKVCVLGDKM